MYNIVLFNEVFVLQVPCSSRSIRNNRTLSVSFPNVPSKGAETRKTSAFCTGKLGRTLAETSSRQLRLMTCGRETHPMWLTLHAYINNYILAVWKGSTRSFMDVHVLLCCVHPTVDAHTIERIIEGIEVQHVEKNCQ